MVLRKSASWRQWLAGARQVGAHGSELANMFHEHVTADHLLEWAEETGQLKRGPKTPTLSQRALNQEPCPSWHWWEAA